MIRNIAFTSLVSAMALPALAAESEPEVLFATHCAVCHGDDRLGAVGPALIPESLRRLKGEKLEAVIANGRDATQMPAFAEQLTSKTSPSSPPFCTSLWPKCRSGMPRKSPRP